MTHTAKALTEPKALPGAHDQAPCPLPPTPPCAPPHRSWAQCAARTPLLVPQLGAGRALRAYFAADVGFAAAGSPNLFELFVQDGASAPLPVVQLYSRAAAGMQGAIGARAGAAWDGGSDHWPPLGPQRPAVKCGPCVRQRAASWRGRRDMDPAPPPGRDPLLTTPPPCRAAAAPGRHGLPAVPPHDARHGRRAWNGQRAGASGAQRVRRVVQGGWAS